MAQDNDKDYGEDSDFDRCDICEREVHLISHYDEQMPYRVEGVELLYCLRCFLAAVDRPEKESA